MDLYAQIINLPMTGEPAGGSMAYKLGHRDARHAAAELVLRSDAAIDAMQADIDRLRKSRRDLLEVLRGVLKVERDILGRIFLEGWQEEVVLAEINKALSEEAE